MSSKNQKMQKMIPYEKPKIEKLGLSEKGFGAACNPGASTPGFICKSGGVAGGCNLGSTVV